jgi:hypothetical protein
MTCNNCRTVWCYFCGERESIVDKADPEGNIYSHNEDWHLYPTRRCPMFLYLLCEFDNRWPLADQGCLERFHRFKTIKLLREFIEEINVRTYKELIAVFP